MSNPVLTLDLTLEAESNVEGRGGLWVFVRCGTTGVRGRHNCARLRITDPPAGAFQDGRVSRCLLLSLANVNIEYGKRKETGKMSNRDNKRASGSSRTKLLLTANANHAATSSQFPAPKKVMHSKTENVDVVATLSELINERMDDFYVRR